MWIPVLSNWNNNEETHAGGWRSDLCTLWLESTLFHFAIPQSEFKLPSVKHNFHASHCSLTVHTHSYVIKMMIK